VSNSSTSEERLTTGLLALYRREGLTDDERDILLDAANALAWDDAVHIAAPWEPRASLCGCWNRNLVALEDERPDGMAGCWTCLKAGEWFDKHLADNELDRQPDQRDPDRE
jgi:hypothetical protein